MGREVFDIVFAQAVGHGGHLGALAGTLLVLVQHLLQVIDALDLIEVSLTAIPANPDARLSGIKAFADMDSPTQFERALRSALQLSQRQAKQATAAAWPLLRRDGVAEIQHREGVSAAVTKSAVAILLRSASRL